MTEKCDSCRWKKQMREHLEANQFSAIVEIYETKCRECTSHKFPPILRDCYEEGEK